MRRQEAVMWLCLILSYRLIALVSSYSLQERQALEGFLQKRPLMWMRKRKNLSRI